MKKLILIIGALILVISLVWSLLKKPPKEDQEEPKLVKELSVNSISLFLDNSVSMKGFVDYTNFDVRENLFKKNMADLGIRIQRLASAGKNVSFKCYLLGTDCEEKPNTEFLEKVADGSLLTGQETLLHNLLQKIVDQTQNHTISIFISDCVLSFGKVAKGTLNNRDNIEVLKNNLAKALLDAKKKNLTTVIVKYEADFNGHYYTNFKEEDRFYTRKLMKKRPYYMIILGNEEEIEYLFAKEIIPASYEGIYACKCEPTPLQWKPVRLSKSQVSFTKTGELLLNDVLKPSSKYRNEWFVAVDTRNIPWYYRHPETFAQLRAEAGGLTVGIEQVTRQDVFHNGKKKEVEKLGERYDCFYQVKVENPEDFSSFLPGKIVFYYPILSGLDIDKSSMMDDALPDSLQKLESRTFGFSKLVEAVNEVYKPLTKAAEGEIALKGKSDR